MQVGGPGEVSVAILAAQPPLQSSLFSNRKSGIRILRKSFKTKNGDTF